MRAMETDKRVKPHPLYLRLCTPSLELQGGQRSRREELKLALPAALKPTPASHRFHWNLEISLPLPRERERSSSAFFKRDLSSLRMKEWTFSLPIKVIWRKFNGQGDTLFTPEPPLAPKITVKSN